MSRPPDIKQPDRRPLKIFAFDPMRGRSLGNRASISVPYEKLKPGPDGDRVRVVDYDMTAQCYYPPVDLDDPRILIQGGIDAAEADPRFHQQMTYALVMRTIETFERALGRRINLKRRRKRGGVSADRKLLILPHAFRGENAFYDPDSHALLFGYFVASRDATGLNIPGQTIYTCLSHDIVVHETSHALLHRLRKRILLSATHPDGLAFHEGFSDIVALFQHFTYRDVVADQLRSFPEGLNAESWMAALAEQFGYARGERRALRTAFVGPDVKLDQVFEPHERGGVLVAAVFAAFFDSYQRRTRDLMRIATGGTGKLPAGDISTDLAGRLAATAATLAQQMLNMCIRAVEYLPPVDIRFSDYLRALVTADIELSPGDDDGLRASVIAAFRNRGIMPLEAVSLSEESLLLPTPATALYLQDAEMKELAKLLQEAADRVEMPDRDEDDDAPDAPSPVERKDQSLFGLLYAFADQHRVELLLDPTVKKFNIDGLHTSYRVGQDGQIRFELIAQLVQKTTGPPELGGIDLYGGTTIVVSAGGHVRYVIAKPLGARPAGTDAVGDDGPTRLKAAPEFIRRADLTDPKTPYLDDGAFEQRMKVRCSLAASHAHRRTT